MRSSALGLLALASAFAAAPALANAPPGPLPDAPAPANPEVAAPEPAAVPADAPAAAPADEAPAPAVAPHEVASLSLPTSPGPAPVPFAFWTGVDGRDHMKPVLQLASLLVGYFPASDQAKGLAARLSTLAIARFGFEGELFGFVSFKSIFERNFGFSLARNGPVGTSVWEGTASLQARENYVALRFGGLTVTGGIFPDPASVDYFSLNVLDAFGMDPYVRDPRLVSGFNQGQGLMVRYQAGGLTAGLSFTAGNPLTSSLAYGFGGDVSSLGTLFSAPLRALSNGIPGSDIQMSVISPSLTFESPIVDVKVAGQFYLVDVDATQDTDKSINGFNARLTAQVKLLDDTLRVFASGAYRKNQQLAIPDLTKRADAYEGLVVGGGFDLALGDFGFGAQYDYLHSELTAASNVTTHYLNVGATYWLEPPYLALGLRWGRTMADAEPSAPRLTATDSVLASLRLML